jgi:PAS domain S-box-containing protein
MTDVENTRDQLIKQLDDLRKRVAELESAASELNWAKDSSNAQTITDRPDLESTEGIPQEDILHKESEKMFAKALLQNSVPMAISTIKEGRYVDVSDAFLDLMGLSRDEIIGNTSTGVGFITPEQRSVVLSEFTKNGRVVNLELQVRTKGGESKSGLFNSTKIRIGQEDYLLTVVTDITQQKQTEESLRISEDLLRSMTNNLPGAVYQFYARTNGEMGVYYVSERAFKLLGIESELQNFLPHAIVCVVPEDREAFLKSIQEAVRTLSRWEHEVRIISTKGKEMFIRGISQPRQHEDEVVFDGVLLDVTDQRHAEEALSASETKYRRLHDTMRDAFVSVSMDGQIIECNEVYLKMLGYDLEELKKLSYIDLTPEQWQAYEAAIVQNQILPMGYSDIYEKEYRRKDGTVFPVELRTILIRDDKGKPTSMWATVREITGRKKVEETLKQANAYNRNLIEVSLDPLVTIGPDGRINDVNMATEQATGYARDKLIGRDFSDYFIDSQKARAIYQQVFREGLARDYELELRHRDGHITSVLYNASVYRDASGQVAGVFAAARDISERKRAEDALRESEAKYRFLAEKINDIVWVADIDFNLTYMSPSVERIMGYTPQERLGKKSSSTMTPESAAKAFEMFIAEIQRVQEEGRESAKPIRMELEYCHKNGSTVWMEVNSILLLDAAGKILGAQGVSRDITERKQTETILGQFKFMVEETGEEIYLVNPDGSIEYVNKAAAQSLGYTVDEMIQIGVSGFDPIYGTNYSVVFQEIKGKNNPLYETVHRTKDGRLVQKEIKCAYLQMGNREYVCGFGRDITDRKSAEMELKNHQEQLKVLVGERTAELTKAYEKLKMENEARKSSENELSSREMELEKGRRELEEMNSALKVLLKQREEDKVNMEMNIISNIKTAVLPYIEKLELSGLAEGQMRVSSMIKSLLGEITSPFIRKVSSEFLGFTPNEIQVASLVKEGKSSKEIAEILNISLNTVHTYRYKIRRKTGLKNNKVNLRSYLQTLG